MRKLALVALSLLVCAPALAGLNLGGGPADLLPPEQAFRFSAEPAGPGAIEVRYAIADGYYLYRSRFRFSAEGGDVRLGAPQFPPGVRHKDEFFGEVETYRHEVRIRIPASGSGAFELKAVSQGCADSGVCYVPMDSKARLVLASAAPAPSAGVSVFSSDTDIARLFEGGLPLVIASFFGFGLLLAFTPCVLPMIPILSGIIAGEGRKLNKARALGLSVAYVLGMAIAYAAAGVAAAYSGSLLTAALQNAWVLGAFAFVFVLLALSMFGFYDLQLPAFLHHRLHTAHRRLEGGQLVSVAAMGVLSALIVTPCVAAPLAGALLYISRTGNVALGGTALFAMALGMGVPLIAVGVSEGALLPKAGAWMDGVKKFFGVLLLAVAVWLVSPLLPAAIAMFAWSALLVGAGVFLRALDPLPRRASGWWRLWKGAGVLSLVAGVALLLGALSGARDPLRPLAGFGSAQGRAAPAMPWVTVASLPDLEQKLSSGGRPAMLDFYADWCVSCKEMEALTFSDPRVRRTLDSMLLLRADVSANTEAQRALLKRFSLFGPPGIIFFDHRGREIEGLRVVGYQDAERFLRTLSRAAGS